jgi:hypothetical protein
MSKALYTGQSVGTISLANATTRSLFGIKADSNCGLDLKGWAVSCQGAAVGLVPVLVEICYCDYATGSASVANGIQVGGRTIPFGSILVVQGFTPEPTNLTVLREAYVQPNGGEWLEWLDYSKGYDCAPSHGFVIRCTNATGVAIPMTLEMTFERA